MFLICYESFFKKELFVFCFRRSPLFAAFVRKWGVEKKGGGEKQFAGFARADICTCWLRPTVEAKCRAKFIRG